jgi:hypothetical protein
MDLPDGDLFASIVGVAPLEQRTPILNRLIAFYAAKDED